MINSLLAVELTQILTYVFLGVIVVAVIVMFVISSKRRKKQEQDAQDLINSVKPGNKVKTIGGICGIVVEVDNDENTFVLETGTEQSGKSYIKFDRQAIYQTDAVVEKKDAKAEEKPAEKTEEKPAEEATSTSEPAPVEAADMPELPSLPEIPEIKETEEEKTVEELRNPPAKKGGKKKK